MYPLHKARRLTEEINLDRFSKPQIVHVMCVALAITSIRAKQDVRGETKPNSPEMVKALREVNALTTEESILADNILLEVESHAQGIRHQFGIER